MRFAPPTDGPGDAGDRGMKFERSIELWRRINHYLLFHSANIHTDMVLAEIHIIQPQFVERTYGGKMSSI
jgi:hypothetical protein